MIEIEKVTPKILGISCPNNLNDPNDSNNINKDINLNNLKVGNEFYGTITTNIRGKNCKVSGMFTVESTTLKSLKVSKEEEGKKEYYNTSKGCIKLENKDKKDAREKFEKAKKEQQKKKEDSKEKASKLEAEGVDIDKLEPDKRLQCLIKAGIKNIWMVGPAGCGKSTIAREAAKLLDLPYLCISCGIGTSATEFIGYKYPTREGTKFAEYYTKPSVILIDEFTALDPAVAQVCNAALANGEIETTTGLVHRHKECIIIATSNTFGGGANRQYVANNQLDASTIDRFIGGIIEVDYSSKFESQYDLEVVEYVKHLRKIIKDNDIRRIASTRMIQAGHMMKNNLIKNWRELLITNWTDTEKQILKDSFSNSSSQTLSFVLKAA